MSVYGSRDGSPTLSPDTTQGTSGVERTLNEQQPSEYKDKMAADLEDVSPPPAPLPSPLVECEPAHNTESRSGGAGEVAVNGGNSSQVEHSAEGGEEKEEGGKGGSDRLLFSSIPGVAINGIVEGYHLQHSTTGSGNVSDTVSREDKEREHTLPAQHGRHGDKEMDSPPHSGYHTPSPISEDELEQLLQNRLLVPSPTTDARPAGTGPSEKRDDEGESEGNTNSIKAAAEGEVINGCAFKPHDFSSTDPPLAQFDEKEGSLVRPKPHPPSTVQPTPRITRDTSRHDTGAKASPRLVATEPASSHLEDVSVASSAASSFHDTSCHLRKDYSSLSLDRHSDVEESGIQIAGREREREKGRGVGRPDSGTGCDVGLQWKVDQMLRKDRSYLFPISNSPVDLVTMLSRLACFTSTLLTTLTPTLRHGAVPGLDEPKVSLYSLTSSLMHSLWQRYIHFTFTVYMHICACIYTCVWMLGVCAYGFFFVSSEDARLCS